MCPLLALEFWQQIIWVLKGSRVALCRVSHLCNIVQMLIWNGMGLGELKSQVSVGLFVLFCSITQQFFLLGGAAAYGKCLCHWDFVYFSATFSWVVCVKVISICMIGPKVYRAF